MEEEYLFIWEEEEDHIQRYYRGTQGLAAGQGT
jgi:hypothetical protein